MLKNIVLFRFCSVIFCIGVGLIYAIPLLYSVMRRSLADVLVVLTAIVILVLIVIGGRRRRKTVRGHSEYSGSSGSIGRGSELRFLAAVLVLSFALKTVYVLCVHETPQMDFRRYYEVAQMIVTHTDPAMVDYNYGLTYQKFLSAFPFTFGYSAVLSLLFRIFGISWQVAEMWNVFCSTVSALLVWHITRQIGGAAAAGYALVLSAFWPSVFLYSNMISAESCFTALLLLCADLYMMLWRKGRGAGSQGNTSLTGYKGEDVSSPACSVSRVSLLICAVGAVLIGCLLGIDAEIRSMAVLLLISMIMTSIGLLFSRADGKKEAAYRALFVTGGAILTILSFNCVKAGFDAANSEWIGPQTAQAGSAGGYNFMVGMNESSSGGFSMDDLNYLFDEMDRTGSATQAQNSCREEAFRRLQDMSLGQMASLFCRKYQRIWGTDDFGASWNISLLNSDQVLTDRAKTVWTWLGRGSTLWYMVCAGLAGLYVLGTLRKRTENGSILFVILTLGCAATHTILESQNRYHYYALFCFAILAAMYLGEAGEKTMCGKS